MTDFWQSKPTYVVLLKVSLQYFVEYRESEQRLQRAFGGVATALANSLESSIHDLTLLVRVRKAVGRTARAAPYARHV